MKEFKVYGHESSFLPKEQNWKLVWADEFDGDCLDESKWGHRQGYWGIKADHFTKNGLEFKDSNIIFKPVLEDGIVKSSHLQTGENCFDKMDLFGGIQNRISGKIGNNPQGQEIEIWPLKELEPHKFLHKFGYYEARVKFQKYDFWWSAFWIQSPHPGTTFDPAYSGIECDIIENFGKNHLKSGNFYGGYGKDLKRAARVQYPFINDDKFHRVGVRWSKDGYEFYFDGKKTAESNSPVSNVPQFILLSTEVVGYREGYKKTHLSEEESKDRFMCDYVRVFDEIE